MGYLMAIAGVVLFLSGVGLLIRQHPVFQAARYLVTAGLSGKPAVVAYNPRNQDFSFSSPDWPDNTIVLQPRGVFLLVYPR